VLDTPRPRASEATVTVVGAGYVGLVTAACLAAGGRRVLVVETDDHRRRAVEAGRIPIHEPGLEPLVARGRALDTLRVCADLPTALRESTMVIVAVGTPPLADGGADLTAVDSVVAEVGRCCRPGTVLVIKSTVPPGTGERLRRATGEQGPALVSCPEFLREGTALEDWYGAARIVVGGSDAGAIDRVVAVMGVPGARVVRTDSTSAELIKYGSNAFLALKISFINEMANVAELMGGDVDHVALGMGLDPRIGRSFLNAGLGFGGSCFPKDVRALDRAAMKSGYSFWMLKTAIEVNEQQRSRFVAKIREAVGSDLAGRRIAVLGLAFKPGTDDMRQAPSIDVAARLVEVGASVVAHDPVAAEKAASFLSGVELASTPYAALEGADAAAIVTEWPEYLSLDWERAAGMMRSPVIVDGRNCLDSLLMAGLGFNYLSIGRPASITRWNRRTVDGVPGKVTAA
jgi:UDPglucose 6-dehydrogenase